MDNTKTIIGTVIFFGLLLGLYWFNSGDRPSIVSIPRGAEVTFVMKGGRQQIGPTVYMDNMGPEGTEVHVKAVYGTKDISVTNTYAATEPTIVKNVTLVHTNEILGGTVYVSDDGNSLIVKDFGLVGPNSAYKRQIFVTIKNPEKYLVRLSYWDRFIDRFTGY